jgi:hypothetical protein
MKTMRADHIKAGFKILLQDGKTYVETAAVLESKDTAPFTVRIEWHWNEQKCFMCYAPSDEIVVVEK